MTQNILLVGSKSQARIIEGFINNYKKNLNTNYFFLNKKMKEKLVVKYIYDPLIKKPHFKSNSIFINDKNKLNALKKKINFFVVCIGGEFGKSRYLISSKLEKKGLKPIGIVNKFSIIDDSVIIGKGVQILPNVTINCHSKIGDYCIINTSSTIDHECTIGNGVHVMGGASIAGKVKIGNFVSIGTNATILPNIKIADGAYIGAGAVVTKNVNKNAIVAGNPAKFIKQNKHKLFNFL